MTLKPSYTPSLAHPTIARSVQNVPAMGSQGLWKEAPILASLINPNIAYRFFTDFIASPRDDTTSLLTGWTVVADAGATGGQTVGDAAGGILAVFADGDDNDEAYVSTNNEIFKFAADKPLWFEGRVRFRENGGTAGKSGFVFGISDTVAANTLADAGTLVTSFDGVLFFKGEDATKIDVVGSNATTQDNDELVTWTDSQWYKLGFIFDPGDGTTGYITPYVDDVAYPRQAITLAGLEEMHIVAGVKMFATTTEASVEIDWIDAVQYR